MNIQVNYFVSTRFFFSIIVNSHAYRYLTEISQVQLPTQCCSILKEYQTKTCAKKLFQILANDIDNVERRDELRVYMRYCLKKEMKNNEGLEK